jgi:chromosome condensin MukBEF complex kleisin-like MukF subunit
LAVYGDFLAVYGDFLAVYGGLNLPLVCNFLRKEYYYQYNYHHHQDESISLLIVDEIVALDYRQDRTLLFQANCWGEQNQGKYKCMYT